MSNVDSRLRFIFGWNEAEIRRFAERVEAEGLTAEEKATLNEYTSALTEVVDLFSRASVAEAGAAGKDQNRTTQAMANLFIEIFRDFRFDRALKLASSKKYDTNIIQRGAKVLYFISILGTNAIGLLAQAGSAPVDEFDAAKIDTVRSWFQGPTNKGKLATVRELLASLKSLEVAPLHEARRTLNIGRLLDSEDQFTSENAVSFVFKARLLEAAATSNAPLTNSNSSLNLIGGGNTGSQKSNNVPQTSK